MMPNVLLIFCFNDTATTEIYTLSLHDALPIFDTPFEPVKMEYVFCDTGEELTETYEYLDKLEAYLGEKIIRLKDGDRKSTRLNSSHANTSFAVFCLKKKQPQRRLAPRDRTPTQ